MSLISLSVKELISYKQLPATLKNIQNENEISNNFIEWIKNNEFHFAGRKLSPNLINYLCSNLNFTFTVDFTNNNIYLQDVNNTMKKKIRNQDYFSYKLMVELQNQIQENLLKYKEDDFLLSIYEEIKTNIFNYQENIFKLPYLFTGYIEKEHYDKDGKKRVDFEIELNINDIKKKIIIEYLEKHHQDKDNSINDYDRDNYRLYKIQKISNNNIISYHFILQKDILSINIKDYENKIKQFTTYLLNIIETEFKLNRRNEYIINQLYKITGNKLFSEILYNSKQHRDKNICGIDHTTMRPFFIKINNKKKYENHLISMYTIKDIGIIKSNNNQNKKLKCFSDFDSDEESDEESVEESVEESDKESDEELEDNKLKNIYDDDKKILFIINEKNEILKYSFDGFCEFFNNLETQFLKKKEYKRSTNKMFNNIKSALITSLEDIANYQEKELSGENKNGIFKFYTL